MARKLGILARQLIWNRNKLPFNCVKSQSQSEFQFQFRTTQTLTLTALIPTTLSSTNTKKAISFHIPERSHADYRRREEQRPNKPTGPSNFILNVPVDLLSELQHVRCCYGSAIFYITSSSCKASHKLLSPVILELSGRFLHVRVYKLVLPECDVGRNLGPFNLTTLPNVTFYQYGKKAAEVFGIDVIGVKKTFEKLFSFGEAPRDSGDLEESSPTETTQSAECSSGTRKRRSTKQLKTQAGKDGKSPSNVILLDMYLDFYFQLNTVDEESLSAVFYFTTNDKDESNNFVTPILIGLGEQCPHVRIYTMFTEEGQSTLGPFDVSAAPIFFFLRKGVKVAEIVGVDIAQLKETFGKLYSREESQDGGAARDMKCSSGRSKRAATRARKDNNGKEVAADSSRIALIKSNAQFHKLLRNVKVESLPAVFFFSTATDDSCARIAPSVRELSERFPHVTVNKIGLKEVDSSVRKFNVRYLPTFIFFQNGKKVCEIIGGEVAQLKDRFAKYYREREGSSVREERRGWERRRG